MLICVFSFVLTRKVSWPHLCVAFRLLSCVPGFKVKLPSLKLGVITAQWSTDLASAWAKLPGGSDVQPGLRGVGRRIRQRVSTQRRNSLTRFSGIILTRWVSVDRGAQTAGGVMKGSRQSGVERGRSRSPESRAGLFLLCHLQTLALRVASPLWVSLAACQSPCLCPGSHHSCRSGLRCKPGSPKAP